MTSGQVPVGSTGDESLSVARIPLAASVADHLREMILQGTLPPGERIEVASLAASRMSATEVDALEGKHAVMAAHYRRREKEPSFALNSEMHAALLVHAANPDLAATHARPDLRARRGRSIAIFDEAAWEEAMGEHEASMAALGAATREAASAVWRLHLEHTGTAVAQALRSGSLSG